MLDGRSQIFSVYDPHEGRYDYYTAADTGPAGNQLRGPNPYLGAPPEDAAVRVPIGARHIGSGDMAIGRVAEHGINFASLIKWGVVGLAIFGAVSLFKNR